MTDDLLTNIRAEIEARLLELRPLLDEHRELSVVLAALATEDPPRARRGRGVALSPGIALSGPPGRTGAVPSGAPGDGDGAGAGDAQAGVVRGSGRAYARARARSRRTRTPTDRAVLAALEHGSHTVAELLVVTGLPAREIRESLRLLRMQRAIVTTDRENKTAYALPGSGGSPA